MNVQVVSEVEEFGQTLGMDRGIGGRNRPLGKIMFKLHFSLTLQFNKGVCIFRYILRDSFFYLLILLGEAGLQPPH